MPEKSKNGLVRLSLLLVVLITLGLNGCVSPDPVTSRNGALSAVRDFVYSPYLDVNLAVHSGEPETTMFFQDGTRALAGLPTTPLPQGLNALTLAFASGECGHEHWGGLNAQKLVDANINALRQADIGYVISTGGADGVFSCASETGMEKFIARYQTSHLLGFDFNIEADQSEQLLESLMEQVRTAMQRHPNLRFSFTLAAIGATERGQASLNPHGDLVMRLIQRAKLKDYFVNLMVMNFGVAHPGNCVVESARCDMGASAIQATQNFSQQYGVPMARIEVTPMIGVNDVQANVFTIENAQALSRFVRASGLGGLHFWSLNRDESCSLQIPGVSSTCSSLGGLRKFDFTNTFSLNYR